MQNDQPQRRGPLLHNPALLSREELIASFLVRHELLDELREQLQRQSDAPGLQHLLLIGQRGMGKTTLLLRLAFVVEDDPALRTRWRPLLLAEEQYAIGDLADLWIETLRALSIENKDTALSQRVDVLNAEGLSSQGLEQEAYRQLIDWCVKQERRLVLMVDNLNSVLERLDEQQQHRLRKLLMTDNHILLLGAAPSYFSEVSHHDRPFYDFFRSYPLTALSPKDLEHLLRELARTYHSDTAQEALTRQPGRVRQIQRLTGGNPRIAMLIFGLLSESPAGDSRHDLEQLLDEVTPFYKHQIEALPVAQQRLLNAIARHWHPLSRAALTSTTRVPAEKLDAELGRLIDQGFVEAVDAPSGQPAYQVVERLYNIYYLMRFSRPGRQDLRWLVSFLEAFYEPQQFPMVLTQTLAGMAKLPEQHRLELAEYAKAIMERVPDREVHYSTALTLVRDGGSCVQPLVQDLVSQWLDDAELRQKQEPAAADEQRLNALRIALEMRDLDLLHTVCQHALDGDGSNRGWHVLMGLSLVLRSRLREAAEHFEQAEALLLASGDPLTRLARVGHLACRKQFLEMRTEALAALAVFKDAPIQGLLLWAIVEANLALACPAEAEAALRQLTLLASARQVQLDGILEILWCRLARSCQKTKAFTLVLGAAEEALQLNPVNADAWLLKGDSHYALGQLAPAGAAYERSSRLTPAEPITWISRLLILCEQHMEVLNARKVHAEMFETAIRRVVKYFENNNHKQALRWLTHADACLTSPRRFSTPLGGEINHLRGQVVSALALDEKMREDIEQRITKFAQDYHCLQSQSKQIDQRCFLTIHLMRVSIFCARAQWSQATQSAVRALDLATPEVLAEPSVDGAFLEALLPLSSRGRAGQVKQLLDRYPQLDLPRRWLPLYAALEVASGLDIDRLACLAPEVRAVAEDVLAKIRSAPPSH